MGRKESSSGYAQRVFSNLVRADQNGAIAAGFKNGKYQIYPGPLVDKDRFEETVNNYGLLLFENGVLPKDVIKTAERIGNSFYAGTAIEQDRAFTNLQNAVDALRNKNGHIR